MVRGILEEIRESSQPIILSLSATNNKCSEKHSKTTTCWKNLSYFWKYIDTETSETRPQHIITPSGVTFWIHLDVRPLQRPTVMSATMMLSIRWKSASLPGKPTVWTFLLLAPVDQKPNQKPETESQPKPQGYSRQSRSRGKKEQQAQVSILRLWSRQTA